MFRTDIYSLSKAILARRRHISVKIIQFWCFNQFDLKLNNKVSSNLITINFNKSKLTGVVYVIHCGNCGSVYIAETRRSF